MAFELGATPTSKYLINAALLFDLQYGPRGLKPQSDMKKAALTSAHFYSPYLHGATYSSFKSAVGFIRRGVHTPITPLFFWRGASHITFTHILSLTNPSVIYRILTHFHMRTSPLRNSPRHLLHSACQRAFGGEQPITRRASVINMNPHHTTVLGKHKHSLNNYNKQHLVPVCVGVCSTVTLRLSVHWVLVQRSDKENISVSQWVKPRLRTPVDSARSDKHLNTSHHHWTLCSANPCSREKVPIKICPFPFTSNEVTVSRGQDNGLWGERW